MQRGELPQIHGVDIGSVMNQELGHLEMSVAAGVVEGHQAALVLGVHVRPVLQQELHNPRPVVARRQVKGSRLSPVRGVTVYIEWGQKGQQLFLITTSCRLQQLVLLVICPSEDWLGERICHIKGRLPFRISEGWISSVLEQHHANVVFSFDGSCK